MVSNLQLGRYQVRSRAWALLDRQPECGCEDVPATLTDDGYFIQCEECEEKENESEDEE